MPALNITALSRRTGVAVDTLRKWESRYGVLRPARTPGGQRRYTDNDVARVEWLSARVAEGYRIGEAARLLGGPDGEAPQTARALRASLATAAGRGDLRAVECLLDQAFSLYPFERALRTVLRPALERVGSAWEEGCLSVAQEHLVSQALRARLVRLQVDAGTPVRGTAVLACAPGEQHDIGLLALAVGLRADGWNVAFLGAATPAADAIALARELGASVLALSITIPQHLAALASELDAIETRAPPHVVVGGQATSQAVARVLGARHLDGDLRRTLRQLRSVDA